MKKIAVQFFSSDKRLQKIFFQNHSPPPPPPSRVKWSAPKKTEVLNYILDYTLAKFSTVTHYAWQ